MTTDTVTITDEQIEALRSEAATAGDDRQVQICDAALGREPDYSRGRDCLILEQDRARELCDRAISAADAQIAGHPGHPRCCGAPP